MDLVTDEFAGFRRGEIGGVPVLWRPDDRFKTLRVLLEARRPLDQTAAARSILPSLLLHGTERDPDRPALARRMEALYGAMVAPGTQKSGEAHALRLTLDLVAGRFLPGRPPQLEEGLGFLSDYVARPRLEGDGFPAVAFERERRHAVAAVRALIDDRTSWASQRAIVEACAGEPMAILEFGSVEALEALDREAPEAARKDFLRCGALVVVAAGAFDETELRAGLERLLEALPERQPEPLPPPVLVSERPPRRLVERVELQQSKLVLVLRFPAADPSDDWIARRLLIGMFGGGPHSRLFREVREKRSLAYYASASLERHKGLVTVQVGLDEVSAGAAEEEALKQLDALRAGDFTDEELDTARAHFVSAVQSVDDSIGARTEYVARQWELGIDRTPEQLVERYLKTTRADVIAAGEGMWLDYSYLLAPRDGGGATPDRTEAGR